MLLILNKEGTMPKYDSEYSGSFEELIDDCTRRAFDALIDSGSKGLRGSMYMIHQLMYNWKIEQEKKKRKK
jgi:hypothetical protein